MITTNVEKLSIIERLMKESKITLREAMILAEEPFQYYYNPTIPYNPPITYPWNPVCTSSSTAEPVGIPHTLTDSN